MCVYIRESEARLALSAAKVTTNLSSISISLPKPLSDQFPVRVCSCPLCFMNRL